MEIGREICSYFENIENPLNKGPEDEISYMNYDLPEETLKPITTYSNEIASAPKNNEEDYDDVDRFMQENNLG